MEVGGEEVAITTETIRRDTQGLLGKLLALTKSLPALPGSAFCHGFDLPLPPPAGGPGH